MHGRKFEPGDPGKIPPPSLNAQQKRNLKTRNIPKPPMSQLRPRNIIIIIYLTYYMLLQEKLKSMKAYKTYKHINIKKCKTVHRGPLFRYSGCLQFTWPFMAKLI